MRHLLPYLFLITFLAGCDADVWQPYSSELVVEGCCLAEEMTQYNAELHQWVCSQMAGMPVDHVPHETFKVMTQQAQAIIRTGETSKYANIILYAGVNF